MKKQQRFLALALFLLGLIGVLSILTMNIPIPEEHQAKLLQRFTPFQIKLLTLGNPTFLLMVFVLIGVSLHEKVNLHAPIIENFIDKKRGNIPDGILKYGALGGLLAGILIVLVAAIFQPLLPAEFIEFGKKLNPSLAARFLYGGITEEILMRFGLMTLFVWVISKITKNLHDNIYWIGLFLAAVLFGLGHLPIAFTAVENPTFPLFFYILSGNMLGGMVFGWLYWKKGLETAMIAHIVTHVVMVAGEQVFDIG
jgi:Type II CAAX prenyl endopeptidase Rce1-like